MKKTIYSLGRLLIVVGLLLTHARAQEVFQEGATFSVTLLVDGKAVSADEPGLFFMVEFQSEAMTSNVRIAKGSSGMAPKNDRYAHRDLKFTGAAWWRGYERRGGRLEIQDVKRLAPGRYQVFATGSYK